MKIEWAPYCHVAEDVRNGNAAHCKALGLPQVSAKDRPPLAVVGGGHSVAMHLDELRAWPGDVWACGSSFLWAKNNGVKATYFCIDPARNENWRGAQHAIVSTCSHPLIFDQFKGEIEVFPLIHTAELSNHFVTTVTAAPELAVRMGYRDVTFFGFDSSFSGTTHLYMDAHSSQRVRVACNGQSFDTDAELLMQAEFMAKVFRLCPAVYHNRSNGLLAAMIEDDDYDITHVEKQLMDQFMRMAA